MFFRSLYLLDILYVRLRIKFGVIQIRNLPLKTPHPDLTRNFKTLSACQNLKVEGNDIESGGEKKLENDDTDTTNDLSDKLIHWVIENNISHKSFSRLLRILKQHGVEGIPKSSRAVLEAKEKEITVEKVPPGVYFHFGLEKNLKILIHHLLAKKYTLGPTINVSVFIDELLLTATNDCLWVILGSVVEFNKIIFGIGCYRGMAKPNNSNTFLSAFVKEAAELLNKDLIVNGINFKVAIKRVICDSPAKAFILNVQGHTGYSSCTKCWVVGESKNKLCFPGKSQLKTDEDYRNSTMYKGNATELLKIPDFGIVSNIPLDYMHLVCYGAARRLLTNLLSKLCVKAVTEKIEQIDKLHEFGRKLKPFTLLSSWNSTDFRQFLLYHGPVVLNDTLDKKYYDNFLNLHIACRLLCMEHTAEFANLAKALLDDFIEQYRNLYGIGEISHNVHGLQHLVDDYITHGALDDFSSLLFEKFLLKLRRKVAKSKKKTIPNLILNESYMSAFNQGFVNLKKQRFKLLHGEKIELDYSKYKYLFLWGMRISSLKGDSYVLLKSNKIVKVYSILKKKSNVFISGKEFSSVGSFYTTPLDSTKLKIFEVGEELNKMETWSISMIDRKCLKVPVGQGKSVMIGLLNES